MLGMGSAENGHYKSGTGQIRACPSKKIGHRADWGSARLREPGTGRAPQIWLNPLKVSHPNPSLPKDLFINFLVLFYKQGVLNSLPQCKKAIDF